MNRQKAILLVLALALMGGTATLLAHLRTHQRLGAPAVRTKTVGDPARVEVDLPEKVLDCISEAWPVQQIVLDYLPKDTTFGQRLYTAKDGFATMVNVVLMGTDRTSLHKPQFCLEGQGWHIDYNVSREDKIHIGRPCSYDLPVMKLLATRMVKNADGEIAPWTGVYVYWFVAPGEYTAQHGQRMWWMARDLFRTGVLQRWAYISYFAVCRPGAEDATFERMKQLIAASVPEFQLTPSLPSITASTGP